ncbi:hypothetical protein LshimejAT787_0104440 [Lyophyllum shimeji]|uniref:Uncharacterized protein n=1 Tax=Lyophyllum shimeji TaxID=47721 RepID=A0A9P3PCK4_LYOSH|nr:hypothetical protein LshimejAT787_0104440 [Lyophyllum shimeji]
MLATNDLFSGPYFGDVNSSNPSSPSATDDIGQPPTPSLPRSSEAIQEQKIVFEPARGNTSLFSSTNPSPCALEQHTYTFPASHEVSVNGLARPSGSERILVTDTGQYQGYSRENLTATEALSPWDSTSTPLDLVHDGESNACENGGCSSPPTSSPPLVFSSSSLPSSQSSAIEPLADCARTEQAQGTLFMTTRSNSPCPQDVGKFQDTFSVQDTRDSAEAQNIDVSATTESSPSAITSSDCVSRRYSDSDSELSCPGHVELVFEEQCRSQDVETAAHQYYRKDTDANFDPGPAADSNSGPMHPGFSDAMPSESVGAHIEAQESALARLSSTSSILADEMMSTDVDSSTIPPRSTQLSRSLPPSSPPQQPSSSPPEVSASPHVRHTEAVAFGISQEENSDSFPTLSSPSSDCGADNVPVLDESSVHLLERASEAASRDFRHCELPVFDLDSRPLLGKRKAEYGGVEVPLPQLPQTYNHALTEEATSTKFPLPNPKRSTIAAQKLQHKKLTTPFRSPALKRPRLDLIPTKASPPQIQTLAPTEELVEQPGPPVTLPAPGTTGMKERYRTERAAAQFKSPLSTDASSKVASSVRMTPTLQALERKLQLLKRAVKIKQDGEEETLQTLLKKWTEAGREIAWEVWELVKERANGDDQGWQPKGKAGQTASDYSWGWNGSSEKNARENERNWGWNVEHQGTGDDVGNEMNLAKDFEGIDSCSYEDHDTDEKKQDTLGTMLIRLGIAPETLGWNEEEGRFQGE